MIFTIQTDDEVSGLDITNALSLAGIQHTIVSKQKDNTAEENAKRTALQAEANIGDPRCVEPKKVKSGAKRHRP